MDLVSLEWHLVHSSEVKDREVPAPSIGLGWGTILMVDFARGK